MIKNMKNKLSTIIAIALPVLFIAIFSIVLLLTRVEINPQHDFVYKMVEKDYYPHTELDKGVEITETYFIYSISTDESTEISKEEADEIELNTKPKSSDGYVIEYDYSRGNFLEPFGGGEDGGYNIYKAGEETRGSKRLNIEDEYYKSFRFIGWIE
jgi:signal transduction histidine kinase